MDSSINPWPSTITAATTTIAAAIAISLIG